METREVQTRKKRTQRKFKEKEKIGPSVRDNDLRILKRCPGNGFPLKEMELLMKWVQLCNIKSKLWVPFTELVSCANVGALIQHFRSHDASRDNLALLDACVSRCGSASVCVQVPFLFTPPMT